MRDVLMETVVKEDDGKERQIGYFESEDKIWYIKRSKKIHYYKILKAWGLDNKVYELLLNSYGMKKVILTETDSRKRYECSSETIEKNKKYMHFKTHRLQIFIPAKYWKNI